MKDYTPSKSIPPDHGKGRGRSPFQWRVGKRDYTHWYSKPPKGTQEELERAFRMSETYLYKLIDFADRDQEMTKEELEEARRIFAFSKQGPKAAYLLANPRSKLVSADVLYILTTTLPATNIAKKYGIQVEEVKKIRRGESPSWDWEYRFVKRLRGAVKGKLIQAKTQRRIFSISKVISPTKKEILVYVSSLRKAKELRRSLMPKPELYKLEKNGTLDIVYPIELVEVLT